MRSYRMRKMNGMTEKEMEVSLKLTPVVKYYHAGTAQKDLDRLTEPGLYTLDGDTYFGYYVKHRDGNVVVKNFSPRELVILTVSLWESCKD